jgi:hypothetical protein
MEGMAKGIEITSGVEDGRTLYREGVDLRDHDLSIGGSDTIQTLRASVRPIVTYTFFGLFCLIKVVAILKMWILGVPVEQWLPIIWGEEETVLLAAILSFWFGSRITTKLEELNIKKQSMRNK